MHAISFNLVSNLVNSGPVTPEFKKGKDVHNTARRSAVWLRGATAIHCGDQCRVFWGDYYSVLFHPYARGRHCYTSGSATHYASAVYAVAVCLVSAYFYYLGLLFCSCYVSFDPVSVYVVTNPATVRQNEINHCFDWLKVSAIFS